MRSVRRSRSGRTRRTACSCSRACRAVSCGGSRRISSPRRLRRSAGPAHERRLRGSHPGAEAPALPAPERGMTELPVKRLHEEATVPVRAYWGDAGLDLAASERVEILPGARAVVGTGLAVAIPDGHAGFVQPRSGLAVRHGITLLNSPGLIDAGYRGELKVILLNTDTVHPFVVEPGMRIAQLVVLEVPEVDLEEVDELPASERGVRGHGSSG